ncbi:MAG TPA: ABC transporter permease [Thermomicrobiaceae bacterium]|nr:ABC transporter permease [Thermomicrobiaceae bacterium]
MDDTARQRASGSAPSALAQRRDDLSEIERAGRHRLLRRFLHNRPGVAGLAVIAILVLLAILSTRIAPYDWQAQDIAHRFASPSLSHLLGTDELGRDIFSRILYGGRYSLTIGFAAVGVSFVVGTLLGTVAGYYRRVDGVVMRLIDIMMAFPGILLAIAIVAALGPGLINVIVAIGINEIPGFTRITRSLVLSLREREFVTAATLIGGSDAYIVRRHVLVNLVSPIIVFASLRISTAVLVGATLSFLGLGIQPPVPEWGAMVSTARAYISIAPHTFLFPTLAIFVTVVAFNLLGDALRDTLDPTIRD